MKANDIMTADPCTCSPNDSLQDVAKSMRDHDCGAVPVVAGGAVLGIVTDRDLAVRALASASARFANASSPSNAGLARLLITKFQLTSASR